MKLKDSQDILMSYLIEITNKFGEGEWSGNNIVEFTKGKKNLGKIIMNDLEMTATGTELLKELSTLIKKNKEAEALKITPEKANKSIFIKPFDSTAKFNGFLKNHESFWDLNKALKDLGVEELKMGGSFKRTETIKNKIVLAIESSVSEDVFRKSAPSGYYTRLRNILYDKTVNDADSSEHIRAICETTWHKPLNDEKITELELEGITIGHYFNERNFIHLFYNPFMLKKTLPIGKKLSEPLKQLVSILKTAKLKKKSIKGLAKRIFISSFLEQSQKRMNEIDNKLSEEKRHITEHERSIRRSIEKFSELQEEKSFIEQNISLKGKGLYEEIERAQKLPFLTKLNIGTDYIDMKFKPTTININKFSRIDHGTSYGRVTAYLGEVGIKIFPGKFQIYNDINIGSGNNPHPHADDNGQPCFGIGDGRNKIYELLAANKFVELSKLLWYWIKIYRNSGAYVKIWNFYDHSLKHGIPMWDDKNKRIEINDNARVESGEQIPLDKSEDYNANIEKFKNMEKT